jgi:hypothetical protein
MKKASLVLIAVAAGLLAAPSSRAGVKVTTAAEPIEKTVAFKTADNKYVSTVTGGFLSMNGDKIGSKQIFTIIDLNGGDLADGDSVKIRYTPHSSATTDQAKSTYWVETAEGIKRNSDGSTFKIKLVEAKYTFQAPSGKFVTGVVTAANELGLSDKQADAVHLELVDLSSGAPKSHKQPAPQTPAPSASEKPAAE